MLISINFSKLGLAVTVMAAVVYGGGNVLEKRGEGVCESKTKSQCHTSQQSIDSSGIFMG